MKIVILTGANSGIGLRATEMLYECGDYHIIMACRNVQTAEEAKKSIVSQHSHLDPSTRILEVMQLDLADFDSVRRFAQNFLAKGLPLHVLICNAGVASTSGRETTKDGWEVTYQTNYLSNFLLIDLLLPKLKDSAPSRKFNPLSTLAISSLLFREGIVLVGSKLHMKSIGWGTKDFSLSSVLEEDETPTSNQAAFDGMLAYRLSKLALVTFSNELDRRLRQEDGEGTTRKVTVNTLCPGFIPTTNLTRNTSFFGRLFLRYVLAYMPFARSLDHGAQCILQGACSTDLEGVSGKWFSNMKEEPANEESYDVEKARQLWEKTLRQLKSEK